MSVSVRQERERERDTSVTEWTLSAGNLLISKDDTGAAVRTGTGLTVAGSASQGVAIKAVGTAFTVDAGRVVLTVALTCVTL